MSKSPWKTLSSKIVCQTPFLKIKEDRVIRPDGDEGVYSTLETPGPSVFIVALNQNEETFLIKLFRYPTQKWSLEVPGGSARELNPLEAAKKELKEETGLSAKVWKSLGTGQAMNGVSSEICFFYLAKDLIEESGSEIEEEGIIEIKKLPFKKAIEMVKTGEIDDVQSFSAIFKAAIELGYLK